MYDFSAYISIFPIRNFMFLELRIYSVDSDLLHNLLNSSRPGWYNFGLLQKLEAMFERMTLKTTWNYKLGNDKHGGGNPW